MAQSSLGAKLCGRSYSVMARHKPALSWGKGGTGMKPALIILGLLVGGLWAASAGAADFKPNIKPMQANHWRMTVQRDALPFRAANARSRSGRRIPAGATAVLLRLGRPPAWNATRKGNA